MAAGRALWRSTDFLVLSRVCVRAIRPVRISNRSVTCCRLSMPSLCYISRIPRGGFGSSRWVDETRAHQLYWPHLRRLWAAHARVRSVLPGYVSRPIPGWRGSAPLIGHHNWAAIDCRAPGIKFRSHVTAAVSDRFRVSSSPKTARHSKAIGHLTAPCATWGDPTWRRANWFILPNKISSRWIRSFPALNRALRSPPKRRQSHTAPRADPQNRMPGSRWR